MGVLGSQELPRLANWSFYSSLILLCSYVSSSESSLNICKIEVMDKLILTNRLIFLTLRLLVTLRHLFLHLRKPAELVKKNLNYKVYYKLLITNSVILSLFLLTFVLLLIWWHLYSTVVEKIYIHEHSYQQREPLIFRHEEWKVIRKLPVVILLSCRIDDHHVKIFTPY